MPNTLSIACVKGVNNLRKAPGITSAQQSTGIRTSMSNPSLPWVQPQVVRTVVQKLSAGLSTCKYRLSPLMNTFFTQFPQRLLLQPLKEN
jgi:hypothetical protein